MLGLICEETNQLHTAQFTSSLVITHQVFEVVRKDKEREQDKQQQLPAALSVPAA